MWDSEPNAAALHCLRKLDVEVTVTRGDHLFAKAVDDDLNHYIITKESYFEAPSILVRSATVFPESKEKVSLKEDGPRYFTYCTGLGLRYASPLPTAGQSSTSRCSGSTPLMISAGQRCVGVSPVGQTRITRPFTVKCDGPTFASCTVALKRLAKEKCGCVGKSCAMKAYERIK